MSQTFRPLINLVSESVGILSLLTWLSTHSIGGVLVGNFDPRHVLCVSVQPEGKYKSAYTHVDGFGEGWV
jgi:hypothetical protein